MPTGIRKGSCFIKEASFFCQFVRSWKYLSLLFFWTLAALKNKTEKILPFSGRDCQACQHTDNCSKRTPNQRTAFAQENQNGLKVDPSNILKYINVKDSLTLLLLLSFEECLFSAFLSIRRREISSAQQLFFEVGCTLTV